MLTRRRFLTTAAAVMGSAALADAPLTARRPRRRPGALVPPIERPEAPPPRATFDDLIAQSGLGEDVSVALTDMATGAPIYTRRADRPMMPASTTKSLTALYALEHLGPGHRFHTRLITTGPVVDGTLRGDLILAGGGDPVLDTDDLAQMASDLAATGLRAVTGAFHVWGGALPYEAEIEPGQADHLGYNPAISGLNLNFNRVHFEWRRAGGDYRVTLEARSERLRPAVGMSQVRIVDRAAPVFTAEGPDRWTVARGALGGGGSRWLPVRQPALYAGEVFQVLAQAEGITLPAPRKIAELPFGASIVQHGSPPLRQIITGMLEYSTNLTAEVIGLAASAVGGALPADIDASAARMTEWLAARYGVQAGFVDHSGLSDENRISADAMMTVLRVDAARLRPLLKQIEILEAPDYPGAVAAKTGTLNFVSALAGYVSGAGGRQMGFAILSADQDLRAAGIASGAEPPAGAIAWNDRAKRLQDALLRRWSLMA